MSSKEVLNDQGPRISRPFSETPPPKDSATHQRFEKELRALEANERGVPGDAGHFRLARTTRTRRP